MKVRFLFLLLVFAPYVAVSQSSSQQMNLYSMIDELGQGLDSNAYGISHKQFMRWKNHWEPRLYPHGDFSIAAAAEAEWAESHSGQQSMMSSTSYEPNWTELGPFGIASTVSEASMGIGRVIDLEMASSDPDILFAGTWGGGVWKTNDGGNNWFSLGTDNALPILKIAGIAVNQANHNQIWAATGDKYSREFGSAPYCG